ncbi:hypothetical protein ABMX48_36410 [Streptomyces cavourensis]
MITLEACKISWETSAGFFEYPTKALPKLQTWESTPATGRLIIETVLRAIDDSTICLFDVTTLSQNVLFEVGYAFSQKSTSMLSGSQILLPTMCFFARMVEKISKAPTVLSFWRFVNGEHQVLFLTECVAHFE